LRFTVVPPSAHRASIVQPRQDRASGADQEERGHEQGTGDQKAERQPLAFGPSQHQVASREDQDEVQEFHGRIMPHPLEKGPGPFSWRRGLHAPFLSVQDLAGRLFQARRRIAVDLPRASEVVLRRSSVGWVFAGISSAGDTRCARIVSRCFEETGNMDVALRFDGVGD